MPHGKLQRSEWASESDPCKIDKTLALWVKEKKKEHPLMAVLNLHLSQKTLSSKTKCFGLATSLFLYKLTQKKANKGESLRCFFKRQVYFFFAWRFTEEVKNWRSFLDERQNIFKQKRRSPVCFLKKHLWDNRDLDD